MADLIGDLLDAARKLGPKNESICVGEVYAVFDLFGGIAEIKRHSHAARLENTEINRQPLDAVHEKNRDLVAAFEPPAQKKIREPVGLLVELPPCHFASESLDR